MVMRLLLRIGIVKRVKGRVVWPLSIDPWGLWVVMWREMIGTRSLTRGSFAPIGVFRNLPGVIKWIPGRLLPRRWGFHFFGLEIGDRGCNWDEVKWARKR